jgi:ATPase subunit of ABC transporter with duplicated ATPase domains
MEKRIGQIKRIERPVFRDPLHIGVELNTPEGDADIVLDRVIAGYTDGYQTLPVSLHIPFGDRVSILGANGAGKSTLLKTMCGVQKPLLGTIHIGPSASIGNMLQEHESLPRDVSVIDFLMERCHLEEENAFHLLKLFSILPEERAREPIGNLSPGGRARLLIGLFAAQRKNVLVLDEPTNHLDLEASEALEEVLASFEGTILLVSHDRYFLERIGFDRILLLDHRELRELEDATEYLAQAEERARKLIRLL